MVEKVEITIDGIVYDRAKAKVPELMCDECDLEDFRSENKSMPILCLALAKLEKTYCLFKKR